MENSLVKFQFYINYHTKFGESLWLMGNTTELGDKEPDKMVAMQYLSKDYWKLEVEIDINNIAQQQLEYKYCFKNNYGENIAELGYERKIDLNAIQDHSLKIYDVWNYAGEFGNAFYSSPFAEVLLPNPCEIKQKEQFSPTHIFNVKAPLLKKHEAVCLIGESDGLNNWDTQSPVLLQKNENWWTAALRLDNVQFPLAYKYGIYNTKKKEFKCFENGSNRICFEPVAKNETIIMHDGFIHLPNNTWKGAGVSIPVFSLRSEEGFGIGEFKDLHLLVDWAKEAGLKLIQILPINDTTATFTWQDSYPYAAISAFALHPIYLHLPEVAGKKHKEIIKGLKIKQKLLNALPGVDYEGVLRFKLSVLKEFFDADGRDCLASKDYKIFFEANKNWLKPYAAFCYLRDTYKTPDPSKWESNIIYREADIDKYFQENSAEWKEVSFYCYLQYHLHLQLNDAVGYAHEKGIVLKGDIPIGVCRYSCDVWVAPNLYNLNLQAGAPPDNFAAKGQNWGFPTYNWSAMQQDGFSWWQQRFEQMNNYFDAFRIDHILGFFRIWSIPVNAVEGIMGRFDPCLPVHINEFGENGIWFDAERFCEPFITDAVLYEMFGDDAENVKKQFLEKSGPETYALAAAFNTQQKVKKHFAGLDQSEANGKILSGLYSLISNVILFEQEGSGRTQFHFRIAMNDTSSFHNLEPYVRERLWRLYIDYFFRRQDNFWREESLKKLPGLKEATNMLVCGEDLGMVPDCVPEVMRQLGILSLEIQRMPKQPDREFFNPADAPYLSVVTPSTHDMSTIRGWWQENMVTTQRFYNHVLGQTGEAPYFCEPWINRAIVLQHLYSPAMWSIFQLQDILGMSAELRREKPEEERINIPANPHHYWRYRMHISLEQLLKEKAFNNELNGYVENSGR